MDSTGVYILPLILVSFLDNLDVKFCLIHGSISMKHYHCSFDYYFEKLKKSPCSKFVMFSLYPSLFYQKFSMILVIFIAQLGTISTLGLVFNVTLDGRQPSMKKCLRRDNTNFKGILLLIKDYFKWKTNVIVD